MGLFEILRPFEWVVAGRLDSSPPSSPSSNHYRLSQTQPIIIYAVKLLPSSPLPAHNHPTPKMHSQL